MGILDASIARLDGTPATLGEITGGKPALLVNVASKCGLTPQYAGLEELAELYPSLAVVGLPCNQFMGQEPGTEAEIKDFCETRFSVDFPMTGKVEVKGEGAHDFYKWAEAGLGEPAVPVWNFHKILVGRDGQLIRAFDPRTTPQDPAVVGAVEAAL